jgi:hypothetical protein
MISLCILSSPISSTYYFFYHFFPLPVLLLPFPPLLFLFSASNSFCPSDLLLLLPLLRYFCFFVPLITFSFLSLFRSFCPSYFLLQLLSFPLLISLLFPSLSHLFSAPSALLLSFSNFYLFQSFCPSDFLLLLLSFPLLLFFVPLMSFSFSSIFRSFYPSYFLLRLISFPLLLPFFFPSPSPLIFRTSCPSDFLLLLLLFPLLLSL